MYGVLSIIILRWTRSRSYNIWPRSSPAQHKYFMRLWKQWKCSARIVREMNTKTIVMILTCSHIVTTWRPDAECEYANIYLHVETSQLQCTNSMNHLNKKWFRIWSHLQRLQLKCDGSTTISHLKNIISVRNNYMMQTNKNCLNSNYFLDKQWLVANVFIATTMTSSQN